MLKDILEKAAINGSISPDEAVFILDKVQTIEALLELAKTASRIRDDALGQVFKFDGFIGPITACKIDPPCKYCGRSAGIRTDFSEEKTLNIDEIELASRLMKDAGIKRVELGGGTLLEGSGQKVIEAVKAVNKVASLNIWINVGPSLTSDDLVELKGLGVKEVCSSLETINPDVFAKMKPGDSLEARMKLAREINSIGLGLTSVMMVGLGSSNEDYVKHLFWLKEFENLSHFCITGLNPFLGSQIQGQNMANSFEVAKVGAVARLVLRTKDISFGGMMNDPRLLPLWIMAGGNRAIHLGAHLHRAKTWGQPHPGALMETFGEVEFVNMLPLTTRFVREMGMEADVI